MKLSRRLLAMLLLVCMVLSMLPTIAFAASEETPDEAPDAAIAEEAEVVPEERDLPEEFILADEVPACEPVDEVLPADFNIEDVETQLSDGRKLGKIPDLHPGDHELVASGAKKGTLPASYNSKDQGYITAVRNQGNFGTCWAHGALASCEAYMIKNGVKVGTGSAATTSLNLSEYQLAYYAYHDAYDELGLLAGDKTTPLDDYLDLGGNGWIATYDLMRWEGPASESTAALKYSEASNSANLGSTYAYDYNVGHVQDAIWIPTKNMSDIKQAIMTYGAGTFGYCHEDEYENESNGAYYNPNDDYSNHDVTVVGWDDNYAVNNFKSAHRPSKPGAWIIKNSWGTSYGTSGYYYISYYDVPSLDDYCYFYVVEPVDNYDHNYQYDGTANIDENSYISAPNNAKFANVFTAKGNSGGKELLEAVAVNVWDTNTSFRIQIYTGGSSTTTPETGTLAATQDVSFTYEGYHTVKLNTPVTLNEGEKFSVIFQNTSGKTIHMPIDKSVTISGWLSTTKNHPSNSTYYSTGSSGGTTTYANYSNTGNLRIKAYTSDVEAEPDPCTVTFKANDTTISTVNTYTNTNITMPAYSGTKPTGYSFIGWVAAKITGEQTTAPATVYAADATFNTANGTSYTFYACFSKTQSGGGGGTSGGFTKATSIAVGDKIVLICETAGMEMTSISTTSTKYGIGTAFSGTPAGTFVFDVVAGSETGSFAFKNSSNYLRWNSGNSLDTAATSVAKNSSWFVTFDGSGNAQLENANTAGRIILWNKGSPRFATYTGQSVGNSYYATQLYKQGGGGGSTTYYTTDLATCDHNWVEQDRLDPTCTDGGTVEYKCSKCQQTKYEDSEPLGHNWAYSCTDDNDLVHTKYCSRAGCTESTTENHNYTISTSGLTTTYTCTLCNHSYNRTLKSYTVNFSVLGSVASSASCVEGESVSLPATATSVEGYEFRGWVAAAVDPETETQPSILTGTYAPSGDNTTVTLYALYSRIEGATSGGGDYTLVTNATQLVTGSKVIIAAAGYNYALSTTQNGNNRGQASITKDTVNDTCTITSGVAELTLLAGNETGTYAFYDPANNGYLYAPTGGNYLRTADTLNDWTITFTNGVPTLADGSRYLRYNNSASLFSGYSSGQADVSLYIQAGSAGTTYFTTNPELPCAHEHKTEYAAVAATCTTAGSAYYFLCNDCDNYYNGNGIKIGEDAATAAAAVVIAALGHDFTGEKTQIANNDAFHSVKCTRCSETSTAPHTFGAPTVVDLTQTETCTACGYVKTTELTGYTVTYNVLGKDAQKVTVAQGSSVTLPTASAAIVNAKENGYDFAGWVTAAIPDKNNTVSPGTPMTGSYTPTGNVTLYALYTKTDSTTTTTTIPAGYSLATSVPVSGDKIIIALKNGSDYYALPNGNKSSSTSIAGTKITVTNGVATSANTYTFEIITNSGNLGIKSTEAGNYLGFNSGKISMNGWGDTKYAAIAAASNGMFTISSSNNAPRGLSYSGTNFTVSNSGASPVYIFKYQAGGTQQTTTTTNYYTTQPAAAKYIVTAGTCTNGSVAITDPQADYAEGAQVTLTATPATGFAFSAWTVTGTVNGQDYTSAITGNTLTVPAADVTVTATFIPVSANEYTVDTTDITGSGSVTADPAVGEEGDPITLTVAPAEHYHLATLTVDGADVTAQVSGNTYTFNMPDHNVIVSATFAEDAKYTVTLNQVTGGNLVANKTADIYAGEEITVTANPAAHYTFEEFNFTGLGGTEWSADDNVLTFVMPANNVTVTATFIEDAKYTVTVDSEIENGTVTVSKSADIYAGETVTLTATPAAHYTFGEWQITPSVTVTSNAFTMPASNVTVSATFIEDPKATVTYSVIGDTTATASVTGYVGTQITLPANVTVEGLDEDYSFAGWVTASTDGEDVTTATVLTGNYNIPASNTTLYAVFTRTEEGQGGTPQTFAQFMSDSTKTSGEFVIAANVGGTYKAMSNTFASKINGTAITVTNGAVASADAGSYKVTIEKNGSSYTISNGSSYLTYSSSTNLGTSSSKYNWSIASGVKGTYRFNSTTSGRGLVYRAGSTDQFGGYATSNVTAGGTEYYDVEVLPIGGGSSSTTYYNTDPEVIHKYTLTVDTNIANGSVTATAGEYEEGDTVNLSYAPTTGYQFDGYVLTKDADSSDVTATYISDNILTMPAFDVTLSANFSLIPATYYSVTPSYNAEGGSISVSPSSAEEGDEITVTISPNTHWTLTSLTVNGAAVNLADITDSTYTFELVPPAEGKDVPVVAVFTEDAKYTVTIDPAVVTGGTLSADKTADIYAGETVTLTATPDAHYTFDGWQCTAGGASISGNAFTMPAANVTLSGSFTAEAHISVTFHSYSAESQAVTTAISDKYYNGDTVLAADVPAVEAPNGYVFMGWYGSTYAENASAPVYVTPAGTAIGSTALDFYAVYGKSSAGSSPYFKLSMVVDNTTYYVGERVSGKEWLGNPTDAADAAEFGYDVVNGKAYLYYLSGDTKNYIYNTASDTSLSFSTTLPSGSTGFEYWTVEEDGSTITFKNGTGTRYLALNGDRFSTYTPTATQYPYEFTKIGGPSYDSYTTDPARIAPTLTAENDTVIFDRDRAVTFNVLTNDDLDYLDATGVTVTVTGTLPTGVVNNNDGTFTFTPSGMQSEVITFSYTITDKADSNATATATVTLKPAERVYYDESDTGMFTFVNGTNAWTQVTDPRLNTLDENIDLAAYEQENFLMYSGGSAKQVTVTKGDKPYVEFGFAGTGFEIIAAMTSTSGAALIEVRDSNDTRIDAEIIDAYRGYTYDEDNPVTRYTLRQVTRYQLVEDKYVAYTGAEGEDITDYNYYRDPDTKEFVAGETWYAPGDASIAPANSADAFESYIDPNGTYVLIQQSSYWVQSNGNTANCYQIPILRMMGLDYGTYRVKVQPIYSSGFDRDNDGRYDFIFDGVNIYDPINDSNYKYISLNDIVSEDGFGSVEIAPCDHETKTGWTFFSAASGNATGEALNRGSFVKRCTVCNDITDTAYFNITTSANPTTIGLTGTSTLSYTLTSDNADVHTILNGLTFTATWTTNDSTVIRCSNGVATAQNKEGSTYAKLGLKVGDVQYASVIKSPTITVANSQPEGYTATFHVPEGASAPAAITQTGASITLPAAVAAPASCDAHTYTFAGWVKSAVAYNDTAPAASDILAAGESVTLNANTDFYALYTYSVAGSGGAAGYYLADSVPTVGNEIIIAFKSGDTYYALPNANKASGASIAGTEITVSNGCATAIDSVIFNVVSKDGATALESASESGNWIGLNSGNKISCNGWGDTKRIGFTAGATEGTYKIEGTSAGNNLGRGLVAYNGTSFRSDDNGGDDLYIFVYNEGGSGGSATYYTTDPGSKVLDSSSAYAATCTEDGYTGDVICSECGMKLGDGDAIPALGHNYEITSNPGVLDITYTCSVCGNSYTEYYEYAVSYVLQPGVEVSGGSRGEGANVNQITLPNAASIPGTYDAQTYTFVGWANAVSDDSETNPTVYAKGEVVNIIADTTFYPVYSFGSGSGSGGGNYEKVTSTTDLANGKYLIVYEAGSVALNGALTADAAANTVTVTINNGKIASTTAVDAAAVTIDTSNGSILGGGGKYIGHSGTKNTLNYSDTALTNTITFDSGNVVFTQGNYTMRFNDTSDQARFRYYTSGQKAIQLYKLAAGTPATTTYTFELKQAEPHYSAAITPTRLSLTFEATATLTATLLNNGEPVTAEDVSFSSSDDSIVMVDEDTGYLVAGSTAGDATITVEMLAADGEIYEATCTVYVSEESDDITVNYIGSETGKVYNWGTRGTVATFLTAPTTGYYTGSYSYETLAAMSGDSGTGTNFYGSELGSAIHLMLVAKQTTQTTYDGTKNLYAYTDCIESDTAHTSGYYTGKTLSSTWDSGSTWNREHVWPSSKCINTNHGADGADIMMLRPESANDNSGRGNTAFGENSGYYNPDAKYPSKAANVRGDVARNVLYTLMRWGNTSKFYGTGGVIENRTILIKWMNEDPVDTWELARNDAAQRITGVRNIFVDYPELAYKLLGATMPTNYSTPSSSGVVAEATYSATRPSNYEPVTVGSGSHSVNATRSASAHRAAPTVGTITGGVVIDGKGNISTPEDFKKYGPDFGVYLAPGQALVFTLNSEEPVEKPTKLQIGAKALNGTPAKLDVLNVGQLVTPMLEKSIASAAEQYYDLDVSKLGWNGTSSDVIVLYNDGEGILDVTQLRYPTTDGITLTHNVSKMAAKNAAKMLQIVYGAPVTDPDPIEPTDIDLSFDSAALALQSDIGMIFYVDEAVMNSAEDVYASFTKALYNENGEITGYAEAEDREAEFDEDLGKYFFRFEGINPAELGSAVTATLYGYRDGELVEGKTINYSVLTYINRMYAKTENEAFRTLLANLAAYGAAAQNYVSYNTANLVTANVADGLMAYATTEAPELNSCTAQYGEGAVSFTGAYLSLREKVTVCYTIDASEYAGKVADLELRIYDGKTLLGTAAFEEIGDKYVASFSGLNALQMRTVLTAEVYDGDTCVSSTLDYSIESYAASMAAGNDALAALVNAMMNFGISAEEYFN